MLGSLENELPSQMREAKKGVVEGNRGECRVGGRDRRQWNPFAFENPF
jgi:hypothetical protein